MADDEPEIRRGEVRDRQVLDLSGLTSPEQLAGIQSIERVAAVVVPEPLAAAYAAIPSTKVRATVLVPVGARVRVHVGPLTVGGDGLGADDEVLVVVGLLVVTGQVTGVLPLRIAVIGSVLAPRGSEAVLGPLLSGGVGNVGYYPAADGQDVRVMTGQVRLSGAVLANLAGSPEDVLVVAGQIVVTGPVDAVGFARVIAVGQFAAPLAARPVLEPPLEVNGQTAWFRATEPHVLTAPDNTLDPDTLRQIEGPASLVSLGRLAVAPGVTEAMVRARLTDIVVFGNVTAPATTVGAVQALATGVFGTIRADDEPGP